MTRYPVVSVIIPTYNRAHYLQETLESVLAQTYPALEIIVVDDGSTDETPHLLEHYQGRITTIRQPNRGGTAARNTGIQAASGAYLTFLDHDDLIFPNKIDQQIRYLQAHPDLEVVHCRWYYIDGQSSRLSRFGPLPTGDVLRPLVLGCFLWSGAPLVARKCIDQVGFFDEAIWSSDWDMWVRIAQTGRAFGGVQRLLGAYRILPDSTMSDVARTERMDTGIFEKLFDTPGVPGAVSAVKDQAYGNWYFWLSRRYYATGAFDDAKRCLGEALRVCPALLADEHALIDSLCNEALDVRVSDPLAFVHAVLDHAPHSAEPVLAKHRNQLVSRILLGMAFKALSEGDDQAGSEGLQQAARQYPALWDDPRRCARWGVEFAMRLPQGSSEFVSAVLQNSPLTGQAQQHFRSHLLGHYAAASAFEDYHDEDYGAAMSRILSAVRHERAWLKNRGIGAVAVHSLAHIVSPWRSRSVRNGS